ncbi:MAG: hypothetical protein ACYDHH_27735 [Solirubrobacteraceae bacterium]
MLSYYTYLEEPTLASYRLDYCPRDQLATVLICPWVVVTGESGATYNVMRALPLPDKNVSMSFGTYRGSDELDSPSPLVFSFRDFPAVQGYRVSQVSDAVVYAGESFRLALGVERYDWTEAAGAVSLSARRLGQACTFWVPEQDGFDHPVLSRSHLGFAEGVIDGDLVSGIFMCDLIYSRAHLTFQETGFTRRLHNYWMNWLVEYEDRSLEGGFAWRGQPGTGFAAAHHYVDGVSHARSDARLEIARTNRGTMKTVGLSLGDEVAVEFAQRGSTDWPIHTYGTAARTSREKVVHRSWNYSENFPLNWGDVEDYQAAYAKLHGRYPSLQGLLLNARVVDERIAFG